ncbi:MAG: PKD domain-containing protein [Candidatus Diapherotrites archaeon]
MTGIKTEIRILSILIALLILSFNAGADWCAASPGNPDITNNLITILGQANNWSNSPTIVVYEGTPYIAYEGQQTGVSWTRIFFTYWNGIGWQTPISVSNETGNNKAHNPVFAINIKNGEMHLVWSTEESSFNKVYYSFSAGFGDPWTAPEPLDGLSGETLNKAKFPYVALDSDGNPHVIFYYDSGGIQKVYYTTKTGGAWSNLELIGEAASEGSTERVNPIYITVDKKKVPNVPSEPIFYLMDLPRKKELIEFATGPGPEPCTYSCGNGLCEDCYETAANCCGDCGVCPPDVIHIIWKNMADGKIVHKQKNIESGASWTAIDYLDQTSTNESSHPFSVADNSGGLHVSYEERVPPNNGEIYYRMLENGNWITKPLGGSPNISNTIEDSLHPTIAVDANAVPKIAWSEPKVDSNHSRIYFKYWNNASNSWQNLGGNNLIWSDPSVHNADYPFIGLNYDGRSYIAWQQKLTGSDKGQIWMVYWGDCTRPLPAPNKPPKAVCKVKPTSGDIKTEFEFDAGDSNDDHTPKENLEVRWDWADIDGVTYNTDWTTEKKAFHVFDYIGTYNTTVQVKDENGKTGTATCTVNIGYGDVLWLYELKTEPSIVYAGDKMAFNAYVKNMSYTGLNVKVTFFISDEEGNPVGQSIGTISQGIPDNSTEMFSITQYDTTALKENENYFINAEATQSLLPEEQKYLKNNECRTIFSVIKIRKVNATETDAIGIAAVVVAIIYFVERRMHYEKKKKKHHVKK